MEVFLSSLLVVVCKWRNCQRIPEERWNLSVCYFCKSYPVYSHDENHFRAVTEIHVIGKHLFIHPFYPMHDELFEGVRLCHSPFCVHYIARCLAHSTCSVNDCRIMAKSSYQSGHSFTTSTPLLESTTWRKWPSSWILMQRQHMIAGERRLFLCTWNKPDKGSEQETKITRLSFRKLNSQSIH